MSHCKNGCKRGIQAITLVIRFVLGAPALRGAEETIATIDTYGLGKVSRDAVLEAAAVRVGDRVPNADEIGQIARKLEAIPGVEQADISVIRVKRQDTAAGSPAQPTVYIGVREAGRPGVSFRAAPGSDVVLPDEIVETYREFDRALRESFRRGNFSEDDSNGYALAGDEAARAVQKRFVPLAQQHTDRLVEVLRTAKSADQREMAAWVLGYAQADISQMAWAWSRSRRTVAAIITMRPPPRV